MTRVLFVCLGNICRSPLGEGIFRRQAEERGIPVEVDSAGTGDYHIGELPDHRAQRTGKARGCDMTMRARQVRSSDFSEFDFILAMDQMNYRNLLRWPGSDPSKVFLMRSFDPDADGDEVPDPYYGDIRDFEDVADMLESACSHLLDQIENKSRGE